MKLDNYGFIMMEQTTFPSSVGDSCAETGRWMTLCNLISQAKSVDLQPFVTPNGVVRYPTGPWGPSNTSDDQVSPLLAICGLQYPSLANEIISQIENNGYKTGNGNLIHLSSFAQIKRAKGSWFQQLWDLSIVGQALIMKLPFRWSDSTKSFTSSANSSADYLNFVNFLAFAKAKGNFTFGCWLATKLISADLVMFEINNYYQPEPNSQWLLDIYSQAIAKIWD